MQSPTLKGRFQTWNIDPVRNNIAEKSYPQTLAGSKLMLEDALWGAYQAGYTQCQADVKDAVDHLGTGDQA